MKLDHCLILSVITVCLLVSTYPFRFRNSIHKLTRPITEQCRVSYGLYLKTTDDDLDSLKIDESKLSITEKDRLKLIQKISLEADEMIKKAGFNIDVEDDEEMEEKKIRETQWSGQSNAEETYFSTNNWKDLSRRKFLVGGDIGTFLLFALIGRNNHGEDNDILNLVTTAAPFIFSWLLISPLLGGYSREATSGLGLKVAKGIAGSWLVSVPVALGFRGLQKGYIPPTPFIIVAMTATFILLFLWRNAYVYLAGETSDGEFRKAGAFEVFKMINTDGRTA